MIGRLEKNVIIARSGVYNYFREELAALKVKGTAPDLDKEVYKVYRSALVVTSNADKFVKLPLIREHQAIVTRDNYRDFALGWTGDTVEVVSMPDSQEIGIQSTVNLIDGEAIDFYDRGFRDVSPLYFADFEWQEGVSPDGIPYDIIMQTVHDVNHLAFTQKGRGGEGVAMDSSLPTHTFREVVTDLATFREEYDESAIQEGVNVLLDMINILPDEYTDKSILTRLVKDFYTIKNAFTGNDTAMEAVGLVADRYEALDAKIMEDNAMLFGKGKGKATDAEPVPPAVEETPTPEAPAPAPEAPAPAPVALTAMEVAQMPDDVSTVSDDQLLALLNGLIKFAKSIAPGEATEPAHAEAPAPAQDAEPAPEAEPEAEEEKPVAMDSLFRMPMGTKTQQTKGLAEFTESLYKSKKGAK